MLASSQLPTNDFNYLQMTKRAIGQAPQGPTTRSALKVNGYQQTITICYAFRADLSSRRPQVDPGADPIK